MWRAASVCVCGSMQIKTFTVCRSTKCGGRATRLISVILKCRIDHREINRFKKQQSCKSENAHKVDLTAALCSERHIVPSPSRNECLRSSSLSAQRIYKIKTTTQRGRLLQTTETSRADICTKPVASNSHYLLRSWSWGAGGASPAV